MHPQTSTLHDRLASAAQGLSYRRLAKLTNVHPETARRYMQGQSPSVEFITAFCEQLGVSAEWLLHGTGPMKTEQVRGDALRHSSVAELLAALGQTLDRLSDRVAHLESHAHSHPHEHGPGHAHGHGGGASGQGNGGHAHGHTQHRSNAAEPATAARASRIVDAA